MEESKEQLELAEHVVHDGYLQVGCNYQGKINDSDKNQGMEELTCCCA